MIFHKLSDDWIQNEDGNFLWEAPTGWLQGRAIFGGLVAASAASLAGRFSDRKLRTMQAQLLGPLTPGPVLGKCEILRSGRTTTFIDVRFFQNDTLCAQFSFIFVEKREGSKKVSPPLAPADWTNPEDAIQIPFIEGLTPEFSQNVELRFAYGGIAFQGCENAASGGFLQFNETNNGGVENQIALLDAWFPPVFTVLDKPTAGSTVTWTAHLFAESYPGYHQFKYDTLVAEGGFSTSIGHLWDSSGKYVGFSEQCVVVFD